MSTISVYLHYGQMTSKYAGLVPWVPSQSAPIDVSSSEARIGEKYLFVYNIKVEDVKHSLRAGVSKPAGGPGEKADRFRRFSGRWRFSVFKVNLDIAAFGRLWISVTSIDTKLETT
ncbi:MAG: hypothetical protein ABF292_07405 [Desulfobacterales bacterium]